MQETGLVTKTEKQQFVDPKLGSNFSGDPFFTDGELYILSIEEELMSFGLSGIQEWLSFYFKSPMHLPELYPENDLFVQLAKLKNTLRYFMGETLITHLGMDYYENDKIVKNTSRKDAKMQKN